MSNFHLMPMFTCIFRNNTQKKTHEHYLLHTALKTKKLQDSPDAASIKGNLMRQGIVCQLTLKLSPTPSARHVRKTLHQTSQFINLINEFSNVIFPPYAANIFLLFSYAVLIGLTLSAPAQFHLCEMLMSLNGRKERCERKGLTVQSDMCICLSGWKASMLNSYFLIKDHEVSW